MRPNQEPKRPGQTEPRVLMLLENESIPEDTRVVLEAESLIEAGYQVSVICPTGRSRKWVETVGRITVYRYPAIFEVRGFWGYMLEYSYSLLALFLWSILIFLRRGFDVVHVHTPPDMTSTIAIFYKIFGKRFVFDHHDLSPELYLAQVPNRKPNSVYHLLRFFERLACRNADRLIATNETQRSMQIERCGADPDRCTVVRNGPNESFLGDVIANAEIDAPEKIVLGYVGAIGFQDGVDYIIHVVKQLRMVHGRDDFLAVIIGDGPALAHLKTLAKQLDVENLIHFTGKIPFAEVPSCIAAFDICLTPDPSNAYNDSCTTIKTMEYMALRKPIVCFRTTENQRTVADAALYADNNDVADFASQTIRLMDDESLRSQLGTIGRQRIDGGLTWHHQSPQLITLYDRLLYRIQA